MIFTELSLINIRSIVYRNKINLSIAYSKFLSQKHNLLKENFKRFNSTKMSNKHLIAICQITCMADKQENYNTCKNLITSAVKDGAKVC
jgi:hypothetical protein